MAEDFVSVIIPCLNQGDWIKETIPRAVDSLKDIKHEIIVLDDGSTDGCCDNLPKYVRLHKNDSRLGVSGCRRKGAEMSQGNILLFTDAHCHYPDYALYWLVASAKRKRALVVPCTVSLPTNKQTRFGGVLGMSDRGLKIIHQHKAPAEHPALLGSIYCIRKDLYDDMGGWPQLPGVWGYSEQAMTLSCWFQGIPIWIEQRAHCNHQNYHPKDDRGKQHFTYSVPLRDQARNGHFIHAAFFPMSYPHYWRPMLDKRFGDKDGYRSVTTGKQFQSFRRFIHLRAVRTEEDFFERVLHDKMPTIHGDMYVEQQAARAEAKEHSRMHPRMKLALDWMISESGRVKDKECLDVGTRDGAALDHLRNRGASKVQGVELIDKVVEYAVSKGRSVIVGDMQQLPYLDNTWDVVTSIHSLEHVPDPHKALDEMVRVCRNGGRIFIVVPKEGRLADRANLSAHNAFWGHIPQLIEFVKTNKNIDRKSIKTMVKALKRSMELRLVAKVKK